ncbi:hypothetical protein [Streptomyces mobaraensis]|uniref:Uncharacterized protein n=1 Tax=Streptomyces mobaraensis TaxID=35621 RepID=A0A5N5W2V6_STRMB|nr:hypothetical protein [Streptomyces mobaraensis]KAB7835547.1 hypothetical protein FRZ00_27040 [Streptomyces mobaraensis]
MTHTGNDHQAEIEAVKQQIPSLKKLFEGWLASTPPMPNAVHSEADLYETGGFADPRLVLYTGTSYLSSGLTVGWCLFGASRNVRPGHCALPHAAQETLADPNAVRALQLLAVDHRETTEAAIEALANPQTVGTLVSLGAAAHQDHQGQPLHVDVGTEIYAHHPGPLRWGPATADVVCIGSPIWIAAA